MNFLRGWLGPILCFVGLGISLAGYAEWGIILVGMALGWSGRGIVEAKYQGKMLAELRDFVRELMKGETQ